VVEQGRELAGPERRRGPPVRGALADQRDADTREGIGERVEDELPRPHRRVERPIAGPGRHQRDRRVALAQRRGRRGTRGRREIEPQRVVRDVCRR